MWRVLYLEYFFKLCFQYIDQTLCGGVVWFWFGFGFGVLFGFFFDSSIKMFLGLLQKNSGQTGSFLSCLT